MIAMQVRQARFGYPFPTGFPLPTNMVPGNKQLSITSFALVNGSNSSANLGLGLSMSPGSSGVYTSISSVQAPFTSGAYFTNVGDSLYLQGRIRFDFIAFRDSVGAAGSPAYDLEYWDGTSWAGINPQNTPDYTSVVNAVIFGPPIDWVAGSGGITGLNAGYYTIRMTVTTAGSTTPEGIVYVGKVLSFREEVESKQSLEASFDEALLLESQQYLIPYFSVADEKNSVELGYKISG